jgi:triosephosphate isomerase
MRHPFIAGNWKMHKTVHEAVVYVKEFRSLVKDVEDVEIVVAPTFTAIHAAAEAARNSRVGIAAQDLHWEKQGAFTGEVSAAMVREAGAEYVIIGHSERRQYFGETDESAWSRAERGLDAGLGIIYCVGELEAEREAGHTEEVLRRQVSVLSAHERLVVAYEPVWAIGTGKTATANQAQEAHWFIKSLLDVPVLYGGSVKPENAEELLSEPDVDGALVGGASLEVHSFTAICQTAARIRS